VSTQPPNRAQLRTEATASRERIVATIGEMRSVADQARTEAVATAKRNAPIIGGALAGLILLRLSMRSSRPRR
jgi:hypothetical protein